MGHDLDLDVADAHRLMFGKSIDEVQRHFGSFKSLSRADELLHMPRNAFEYYVFAFAVFVQSPAAAHDPDSASAFLRLLLSREAREPGSVRRLYPRLRSAVDFVGDNPSAFDADQDIFGSFDAQRRQLHAICEG